MKASEWRKQIYNVAPGGLEMRIIADLTAAEERAEKAGRALGELKKVLLDARAALVGIGADFRDEDVLLAALLRVDEDIGIDDIDPEWIQGKDAIASIDAALAEETHHDA